MVCYFLCQSLFIWFHPLGFSLNIKCTDQYWNQFTLIFLQIFFVTNSSNILLTNRSKNSCNEQTPVLYIVSYGIPGIEMHYTNVCVLFVKKSVFLLSTICLLNAHMKWKIQKQFYVFVKKTFLKLEGWRDIYEYWFRWCYKMCSMTLLNKLKTLHGNLGNLIKILTFLINARFK